MKKIWAACEAMAVVINKTIKGTPHSLNRVLSKHDVFNNLYGPMKDAGLLDRVLASDDTAVFEVVASPAWELMQQKFQFKLVQADSVESPDPGSITNSKGEVIRPNDAIRLALWFIEKVGGIENASRAFDAGKKSMLIFTKRS